MYMYMEMELMYDKNILTLTGNVRNSCQKSDHQNTRNSHLQHIKQTELWRTVSASWNQPTILQTFSPTLHLDMVFHCQHNMLLNSSEPCWQMVVCCIFCTKLRNIMLNMVTTYSCTKFPKTASALDKFFIIWMVERLIHWPHSKFYTQTGCEIQYLNKL